MRSFIVGPDPGEVARLAQLSAEIGFPAKALPGLDALSAELAKPGTGRALVLLADPA